MLAPGLSGGPSLGPQRIAEPKSGKNRVHVDLGIQDQLAEVRRLIELGATEHGEHHLPGPSWTGRTAPEANEFRVGRHDEQ